MNVVLAERTEGGGRVLLVRGDLTEEGVDAIVNAANSRLQHAGGVAAAIARKGGPDIQRESNAIGYVATGSAAATGAGSLPCRLVIHAVGPIWGEGDEDAKLRGAIRASLAIAAERGLRSVSAPAISSGIYGFPKDRCARILLAEAVEHLRAHPDGPVDKIRFCLFDEPTVQAFQQAWLLLT